MLLRMALLISCFFACFSPGGFAQEAVVYYASETSALENGKLNASVVARMVDGLVMGMTGKFSAGEAWGTWIKPTDRVGIKVASAAGGVAGTHPEVVRAIVDGLRQAGVPSAQIIVWDKRLQDLLSAGFVRDADGYQLRWTEGGEGYDGRNPVILPVLGRIISGDLAFEQRTSKRFSPLFREPEPLSDESHFSRVLTAQVDKVINVPSMTDSFFTGIAGAIPNMTLGNLDNWRRFTKPPLFGNPYLAELFAEPLIKDKVVVTIMDGLTLQFAGGPLPNPDYSRPHQTLYGGTDPVAIDALAVKLIDEYRLPAKLPPIGAGADYIKSAEQLGLGCADPDRIEVRRIGTGNLQ